MRVRLGSRVVASDSEPRCLMSRGRVNIAPPAKLLHADWNSSLGSLAALVP